MALRFTLNRNWRFLPEDVPEAARPGFDDSAWEPVSIPHTVKRFPHHNFDDRDYQFVSWYRRVLDLPADLAGKRLFLDFDGVMLACEVFVNGVSLGEHKGGYTPFSHEITRLVTPGEPAVLALRVDSTERKAIPPFGKFVDYLTFGGVYRDVFLRVAEPTFIADVFAYARDVLDDSRRSLHVQAEIEGFRPGLHLEFSLLSPDDSLVAKTTVPVESPSLAFDLAPLEQIRLWDLDDPHLYTCRARLLADETLLDENSFRFGFREARFSKEGPFYLNGRPLKLIGLDRHQTFPYIGQAAPARLQCRDADFLKFDLACNIVRTSHYPQAPAFLDRCDEIGLLVFEELPGWSFIGDDAWKQLSLSQLEAMIRRDRNRPSIVLWGVRINESNDDHDFYVKTNALAHSLDPSRQTGGVRCFIESEFLEDVFTFNDFSNGIREPIHTPHLVTEFNGHMFPTKSWDCEERRIEHALRHARIQAAQFRNPRVAGAIGWCAFDYNTHYVFGSGDRICYHGVADIFRLPKWAAYAYASQADPANSIVLFAASTWTPGDRSGGVVEPLVVFSNCASLKVWVGSEFKGEFFPEKRQYEGLPHPPFIIRGLGGIWGDTFQDLRLEGYLAGEKVAELVRCNDPLPVGLRFWSDTDSLLADESDTCALYFQLVDKTGHVCSYASNVISFSLDGPAELIGTNPFAPQGGQGCLYLRAGATPGKVTVTASPAGLPPAKLTFTLLEAPSEPY